MRGKASKNVPKTENYRITPAYAGKSRTGAVGDRLLERITPAYAGKRYDLTAGALYGQDPPRLCGEKEGSMSSFRLNSGSPPPMRGKGVREMSSRDDDRITPAYAGKRR